DLGRHRPHPYPQHLRQAGRAQPPGGGPRRPRRRAAVSGARVMSGSTVVRAPRPASATQPAASAPGGPAAAPPGALPGQPPVRVAIVITKLEGGAGILALRGAQALDPRAFAVTIITGRGDRLIADAEAAGL